MIQDYLDQLIVVGDRLIIELSESSDRTDSGLYLPPNVKEKEEVQSGYVLKVGPGHPIAFDEESEPWKSNDNPVKYIPVQAKEGDFAFFLKKYAYEVVFKGHTLMIVPQTSILLLQRDEGLFE